jgi:hypothetical protein
MLINVTTTELKWDDLAHHNSGLASRISFVNIYASDVYHYKNDDITVHISFKIVEHENLEKNFEVTYEKYIHVTPTKIKFEVNEHEVLGSFAALDEAKEAAQNYFNHHHYVKGHH